MKLVLIPAALTDWRKAGRLQGRVELPLAADARETCAGWSDRLRDMSLERILHAKDDLSKQIAQLVAQPLGVPIKVFDDLVEVDLGLWAGLTEAQLKSRYATAHRQLREAPLSVNPPNGEAFADALARVKAALLKRLKRNGKAALGIVLRPMAMTLALCVLGVAETVKLWEVSQQLDGPVLVDDAQVAALLAPPARS